MSQVLFLRNIGNHYYLLNLRIFRENLHYLDLFDFLFQIFKKGRVFMLFFFVNK